MNENVSLTHFIKQDYVVGRFRQVLGDRAPEFVSSLLTLSSMSSKLAQANPASVVASAMIAATLDLPIEKNLGFAHIIPYNKVAQFQMGYKGFVQLAMRSRQYKCLNAVAVLEGELVSEDKLRGLIELDPSKATSDKIIGYAAHMTLTNGFERSEYWSVEKVRKHAERYSQAYRAKKQDSPWFTAFDPMALKTVLKSLLSHWGPLSVQMQTAIREDQAMHPGLDTPPQYPDNQPPAKGGDDKTRSQQMAEKLGDGPKEPEPPPAPKQQEKKKGGGRKKKQEEPPKAPPEPPPPAPPEPEPESPPQGEPEREPGDDTEEIAKEQEAAKGGSALTPPEGFDPDQWNPGD